MPNNSLYPSPAANSLVSTPLEDATFSRGVDTREFGF